MFAPPPDLPMLPSASCSTQYERVLLLPMVCCVPPMHHTMVPGRFSAINCAAAFTVSGGTSVTRWVSSGVHFATSSRISSIP